MYDSQFFIRNKGENPGVNVDLSARCGLECPRCQRQTYFSSNKDIPGHDLTVDDFVKITDYFKSINFCGQLSDPVHNEYFIDILRLCKMKNVDGVIHNVSSLKSKEWYIEAFQAHPDMRWVFGIDGLPKDSHKYRTNQDGEKLFQVLKTARKHLTRKPIWQYIIFAYNEDTIDEAHQMAIDIDVDFMIVNSSRWHGPNDPFKPKNPNYSLNLHNV